ncbi:MAG: hypothetical protein Fur0042_28310 [Cyanophyceae cyanobacterium]
MMGRGGGRWGARGLGLLLLVGIPLVGGPAIAQGRCRQAAPLPPRQDFVELDLGDRGPAVRQAQTLLRFLGFEGAGDFSGDFYDEALAEAVRQFQQQQRLEPSGRLDLQTWQRLLPPADPARSPCP